jgi:hypothetical protein
LCPPDDTLRALGELAIGRAVYLACGGYALHGDDASMIVDPNAADEPVTLTGVLDAETFAAWGLRFSAVRQPAPLGVSPAELGPAVVALRLGLLMRCLDTAFLHLECREGFGQKLLHHQLMKARFANTHADAVRLVDELTQPGVWLDGAVLLSMHRTITQHFAQAAKLMGGHGFLNGSCHALEFLSALLFAIHRPGEDATAHLAAARGVW